MSERDAFLRAICDNPDDDTPRLVFADWLDEHDDPDRAEFIRLQIELAGLPDGKTKQTRQAREKELLDAHRQEWAAPVADFADSYFGNPYGFRRGFVEAIGADPETFLERGAGLFARAPIREVRFAELEEYDELAGCEHLLRVRVLDLTGSGLSEHFDPAPLLTSRNLANLTTLILGGYDDNGHLDRAGVRALVASEHLGRLVTLGLSGNWLNQFDPDTFADLVGATNLPSLLDLDLASVGIGDDGAERLAGTSWAAQLKSLNLAMNAIGDRGCRAILESRLFEGIERLDLRRNLAEPLEESEPIAALTKRLLEARFGDRVWL